MYRMIKQMTEAIVTSKQSFNKVYLIEYPHKNLWTLGFETSKNQGRIHQIVLQATDDDTQPREEPVVNLFVPTTPNPTSGYFIMARKSDLIEVDISVEDSLKMIVSGGVFVPNKSTGVVSTKATQHSVTSSTP